MIQTPDDDTTFSKAQQQAIAKEYYENTPKPLAAKQKPLFALCVIGLLGVGKSTVVKKISEQIPMVNVAGDEVRELIYKKGLPVQDSSVIANIGQQVVEYIEQDGYRRSYDNDFGNHVIRDDMLEHTRGLGLPVIWIRVIAPEAVIVERLHKRPKPYLFKDTDAAIANYYRRKELHEREALALAKLPYVYTFDTSRSDLDSQVSEAVVAIQCQLDAMSPKL